MTISIWTITWHIHVMSITDISDTALINQHAAKQYLMQITAQKIRHSKFACHLIQWFNLFDSLCPRQILNPPCKPRYFLYFCCNYTSDCVLTFWFTEIKRIIYNKYIKIKRVKFCNFSRFKNYFFLQDSITNVCDFPTCLWFSALTQSAL